jgi:hypothetical protein
LVKKRNERGNFEEFINWRMILKWILKNKMGGCGVNLFGSRYGPWQALVNAAMKLMSRSNAKISEFVNIYYLSLNHP